MSDQAYTTDKGLGIVVIGDYGDEDVSIYLADDAGEIVMWTEDEWKCEPSLLAKIAEVICCGCIHGPESLREQFGKPKPKPGDEDYEPWGGWGALGERRQMTYLILEEGEEQEITLVERTRWGRRKLIYPCDDCSTNSQTVFHFCDGHDWKDLTT